MQRGPVEQALAELDALLQSGSNVEQEYQEWFERHSIVFMALGYQEARPHPVIIGDDGKRYVPDFLVRLPNGSWEIFELKTPDTRVLLDRERRAAFAASFNSYVSQCHEYTDALSSMVARERLFEHEGVRVQAKPQATIVAGRSTGLDRDQVHTLCARSAPPLKHMTFDDVRSSLEHYRTFHFGIFDRARGFAIQLRVNLQKPVPSAVHNCILTVGATRHHDFVAAFVDPRGFLTLEVIDSDGVSHTARSTIPLEDGDYNRLRWLYCDIGVGDGFGFITIELDGRYFADLRIQDFPFHFSNHYALGADPITGGSSWMTVASLMIFKEPISYRDRAAIRRIYSETIGLDE